MRYHLPVLSVLYGPFRDLEEAFAERLVELRRKRPCGPIAVVAPSRRLADRLQRLLAAERGLSLLGVEFHTFFSLACALVDEAGGPAGRVVTDAAFHDRLMDGLLDKEGAAAAVFKGEVRPRALAAAVRASVRDLIDAGVDAGELEEHFGSELLKEPYERERLAALLRLLQEYERRLGELGVVTASGLTRLATAAASSSAKLKSFAEVLYYGFYDLTGLQLDFFEAVTGSSPSVLFFPYEKGHPAYKFADAFFEQKLVGHGAERARESGASTALGRALDGLFAPDAPVRALPQGRLVITSASGHRDEIWSIAKETLRIVEGGICSFEDIGIVARSLESYRASLSEIFQENAIPLDLGSQEPLLSRPLAKKALNLLSLKRHDFPASAVEDLLASPYWASAPKAGTLRHWRLAIRRLGIAGGWLQWRKLEGFLKEGLELFLQREAEGEKGYLIPADAISSLWKTMSGLEHDLGEEPKTWAELSTKAVKLLNKHLALPEDSTEDERRTWESVLETASGLAQFDILETAPSWDDWLESFEQGLKSRSAERGAAVKGVRCRSAMDARGESFKILFLIGLQEGVFPRRVQEDPLLRDAARAALRHPAGYWIRPKAEGHDEERLLFHLAAASARERLYCSFQRCDEDGKALVPSLYLRELCRAAGTPFCETTPSRRVPRDPLEKLAALEPELLSPSEACLALDAESVPAYLKAAALRGGVLAAGLSRLPVLASFGKAGELDGLVGPPEEFLSSLKKRGVSPTALDELAQCPFRFFAKRLLGLPGEEEASDKGELAPWLRGKIYHAALEHFYSRLPAGFWDEKTAAWEEVMAEALEAAWRGRGWREMGVYPVLWEAARAGVAAHLRAFLAWELAELKASGFRPRWLEKELEGPWPTPVPKKLAGLKTRGRLDRVDQDARGRVRVIDYKTRWTRGKLAALALKGKLHQLPLYAELASAAAGGAPLDSLEVRALEDSPQMNGRPRAHAYEGGAWQTDRAAFFKALARRLESLAAGEFPIRPEDGEFGHCARCAYTTLCRKGHGPSRVRAARVLAPQEEGA